MWLDVLSQAFCEKLDLFHTSIWEEAQKTFSRGRTFENKPGRWFNKSSVTFKGEQLDFFTTNWQGSSTKLPIGARGDVWREPLPGGQNVFLTCLTKVLPKVRRRGKPLLFALLPKRKHCLVLVKLPLQQNPLVHTLAVASWLSHKLTLAIDHTFILLKEH